MTANTTPPAPATWAEAKAMYPTWAAWKAAHAAAAKKEN